MMREYKLKNGETWLYDDEKAHGVLRGFSYIKATVTNSRIVRTRESFIQKIRLAGELAHFQSDDSKISQENERILKEKILEFEKFAENGFPALYSWLVDLRFQQNALRSSLNSMFRSVDDVNRASIEAAETMVKGLRIARDSSVAGVSIIAMVGSGGTAALAIGVSVGGSGVSTWQDTGSAFKGALAAGFALMPLGGGKISSFSSNKVAQVVVSKGLSFAGDVGSGVFVNEESIRKALSDAALKFGVGCLADGLAEKIAKHASRLINANVSVLKMTGKPGRPPNVAAKLVEGGAAELGAAGIMKGIDALTEDDEAAAPVVLSPDMQEAATYIHDNVLRNSQKSKLSMLNLQQMRRARGLGGMTALA